MSKYRVWIDDGKHNEQNDGQDIEAPSARDAVEAWAGERYSVLQHVDPGMLLVRTPPGPLSSTGYVEKWTVSVQIHFRTEYHTKYLGDDKRE